MKVTLIAVTEFIPPSHVPWQPNHLQDDDPRGDEWLGNVDGPSDEGTYGGSTLVEFAGRACYQSWNRPNVATASNAGYVAHLLDVGHLSVLEHASATFYVEGVSRSLTHELVRHRHLSFSQLSQRYVDESNRNAVIPPAITQVMTDVDPRERDKVMRAMTNVGHAIDDAYGYLVQILRERGLSRKQAREAARCVLPNMTETKIVVTGNYRAWRHFIDLRASAGADAEIRELALELLRQLGDVAPNVFGDYIVTRHEDGTTTASSPKRASDG